MYLLLVFDGCVGVHVVGVVCSVSIHYIGARQLHLQRPGTLTQVDGVNTKFLQTILTRFLGVLAAAIDGKFALGTVPHIAKLCGQEDLIA